jgi:class 3 adenylate cyclase
MHEDVARLGSGAGERLALKIGLHAGPCFAVTMNETLDYFGSTVNLAAAIQAHARGGETLFERALASDPAVAGLLRTRRVEPLEVTLKGSPGLAHLVRVGESAAGVVGPPVGSPCR